MLSLDEPYYDKMKKVVLTALQAEQLETATFPKNKMCCFKKNKKHIYMCKVRQCTKSMGHRILAKCPRIENWLKYKKIGFT